MEPLRETGLELVVPHLVGKERKIAPDKASRGHFTHPKASFGLLPRAPVTLEHRGTGLHLERHADPIDVEYVGIRCKRPIHVIDRIAVLYLVIHVEDPDPAVQPVPPDIVNAEVQQHAAVLAAGEGDVNVVEALEEYLQPLLGPFIDIHGRRLFPYSIATYSFHSRTGAKPSARNTSAWRISVTERIA